MFSQDDVFQYVDCKSCGYFERCGGNTINPPENICTKCNFGNEGCCDQILLALKKLIEDDYLNTRNGYLADSDVCKEVEKEIAFDVSWEEHPYWFVYYDEREPKHYDTLEEVWKEMFV